MLIPRRWPYVTSIIIAEENNPIVTPARSNSLVESFLPPRASRKTMEMTISAPRNAHPLMAEMPHSPAVRPSRMAISAPSEPPLETPSVYGVANALRKSV